MNSKRVVYSPANSVEICRGTANTRFLVARRLEFVLGAPNSLSRGAGGTGIHSPGEMDADGVKVEEFDGSYACVICSESVRGGDALHCGQCSINPVHFSCVRGSAFSETCPQCSMKTMQPWTGRVGGASSSATIDLVAAETDPAASGKGGEILDDADDDSDDGCGEGSDEHSGSGGEDDDDDSDGALNESGLDDSCEEDEHDDEDYEQGGVDQPRDSHDSPRRSREDGPPLKKSRGSLAPSKVFTFVASHSPVRVQLLSSHTIHDLCDAFCTHTSIGGGETVYSHLWNVTVDATGQCFESGDYACMSPLRASEAKLGDLPLPGPTATLRWEYDYGSSSRYTLTLLEVSILTDGESEADFPRKVPAALPAGYAKYSPPLQGAGAGLNDTFAGLNKWAFGEGEGISVCLFQPESKHNHGLLERGNDGVRHMIFMPAAPPKDLAAYLYCLDAGVRLGKPKIDPSYNFPVYNWYSMIILPAESATDKHKKKWQGRETGFVDMKVVPADSSLPSLNKTFPKLAALAGFAKDKKVPKGWLTFKDGTLRICTGKALSPKLKAPPGTAFHGLDQHEPADKAGVLFSVDTDPGSLHDLFCVAEGLLGCL